MKSMLFGMIKSMMLVGFILNVKPGLSQNSAIGPESKTGKPYKNAHISFGAETYINGDAHGTFYSAGINVKSGRSMLAFAPCLQKRSQELNAGKISFSYLISGINESDNEDETAPESVLPDEIELHALCNLQYTHNARLSYCASNIETITNPENTINYNDVRFSTITATLGPEIDFYVKKFKIRTYAGASFFHHVKYPGSMYRPGTGTALVFGLGVYIPNI